MTAKPTAAQIAELRKLLLDAQTLLDQVSRGLASLEERVGPDLRADEGR